MTAEHTRAAQTSTGQISSSQKIHRHLKNGVEVYIEEQHFAPVCCIYVCVKAGSIDEGPSEVGMAHVLEHMLFKGTERHPIPGGIARIVEGAGGDINAYTTFDRTVYEISAPSSFIHDGAGILLDMVSAAKLDAEELSRETEVIVEEIKRGNDNPGSKLSRATLERIYKGTECGRAVIGTEESVRSFSKATLEAFYRRWYVPNNMTLVASGAFDAEALCAFLEERTVAIKPANLPLRIRPEVLRDAATGSAQIQVITGPYQMVRLQLAVRGPCLETDALPRWDALMSLLGQGDSSRLAKNVKDNKQLVTSIDAGIYAPRYPAGMATISFFTTGESATAALTASIAEIEKLAHEEPSESEVRRIQTAMKAERIYARESVEGVVRQSLACLLTSKGIAFEEHYIKALAAVTPRSIQATAREFMAALHSNEHVISCVAADSLAECVTPQALAAAVSTNFAKNEPFLTSAPGSQTTVLPGIAIHSQTTAERNPAVKQIILDLSSGTKVHINYRKSNKIPACAMGIYSIGGQLLEAPGFLPGTASLLSQMLTRGTAAQDYRTFVTDLEDRAASIQAFQGRDIFGVRADCLAEDFEHVLKMAFDSIFAPAFDPGEFAKIRRESLEALEAQKDSPGSRLSLLAGPMFFGDHPYARPLAGTEQTIAEIPLNGSSTSLEALWQLGIASKQWVVAVAGDFDEDALILNVATFLNDHLRLRDGQVHLESKEKQALTQAAAIINKPQAAFEVFEREQAHILLGFRGVGVKETNRTALEIAVTILSGQGGRLFGDLREKQSLAYSVSASQSVSLCGGNFVTYIGTAADKAETAFVGLKKHLEDLASHPPSQEELSRARQSLLGGQALDSQQLSYQCSQLAFSDLYGLGFDNFLGFSERIMSVTAEQVSLVLKTCMLASAPVAAIIGPKGTWEPDAKSLKWDL